MEEIIEVKQADMLQALNRADIDILLPMQMDSVLLFPEPSSLPILRMLRRVSSIQMQTTVIVTGLRRQDYARPHRRCRHPPKPYNK